MQSEQSKPLTPQIVVTVINIESSIRWLRFTYCANSILGEQNFLVVSDTNSVSFEVPLSLCSWVSGSIGLTVSVMTLNARFSARLTVVKVEFIPREISLAHLAPFGFHDHYNTMQRRQRELVNV